MQMMARLAVSAQALGIAEGAYRDAAQYAEKRMVAEITALLEGGIAALKDQEREVIDYYAVDLVELAIYTVPSRLMPRAARQPAREWGLGRVN